jgi:hypothetical protein
MHSLPLADPATANSAAQQPINQNQGNTASNAGLGMVPHALCDAGRLAAWWRRCGKATFDSRKAERPLSSIFHLILTEPSSYRDKKVWGMITGVMEWPDEPAVHGDDSLHLSYLY